MKRRKSPRRDRPGAPRPERPHTESRGEPPGAEHGASGPSAEPPPDAAAAYFAPPRRVRAVELLLLAAVLAVGVALQWPGLHGEVLERVHGWRQCQTAMVARNFVRDGLNPLVARVDYMGDGQMQLELPLYPYLVAACYQMFGVREISGRVVALLFGMGSAAALFALGRMLWSPRAGLVAAAVFSWTPLNVFFNRAFMPDSTTICLSLWATCGLLRYLRSGASWALLLGAAAALLTLAGKPPIGVVMGPPWAAALLAARGGRWWRDARLNAAVLMMAAGVAGWMKYQGYVNNHLGDDLGISFTNAGVFNQRLVEWYFGRAEQWTDPAVYRRILSRGPDWLGHWAFVAAALTGLLWPSRDRAAWLLRAWLLGGAAYLLVFLNVNLVHNYYQMPLIPILATGCGVFVERVLSRGRRPVDRGLAPATGIRMAVAGNTGRILAATLLIAGAAGLIAATRGVLREYDPLAQRRIDTAREGRRHPYWERKTALIEMGRRIGAALPADGRLVALAGDGYVADVRDPQVMYYVNRRGFIIAPPDEYREDVERRRRRRQITSAEADRLMNRWVDERLADLVARATGKGVEFLVVVLPGAQLSDRTWEWLTSAHRLLTGGRREGLAVFRLRDEAAGG